MHKNTLPILSLTMLWLVAAPRPAPAQNPPDPATRRAALATLAAAAQATPSALGDTLDALAAALADEDLYVRRTAAKLLGTLGPAAKPALETALANPDPGTRQFALAALGQCGALTPDHLWTGRLDPDQYVRAEAVRLLGALEPHGAELDLLFHGAAGDPSRIVRDAYFQAQLGPAVPARLESDTIETLASVELPAAGWKFRLDPDIVGLARGWQAPGYDDAGWEEIETGQHWQKFGHDYIGPAWYRLTFELPADFPPEGGVVLHFEGVDESVWAWVNGRLVGASDIGAPGWNVPISFDITGIVNRRGKNHFAFRIKNTILGGGIWRPVFINAFRKTTD